MLCISGNDSEGKQQALFTENRRAVEIAASGMAIGMVKAIPHQRRLQLQTVVSYPNEQKIPKASANSISTASNLQPRNRHNQIEIPPTPRPIDLLRPRAISGIVQKPPAELYMAHGV